MNIQPKFDANATERALSEAYAARREGLPGGAALQEIRDASMARFSGLGLPNRRIEAWHYTDLKRLLDAAAALPANVDTLDASRAGEAFADIDAATLVFAGGHFDADLSDLSGLGDGVAIATLGGGELPDWARAELANRRPDGDNVMFDLTTGLAADGVLIRVAAGSTPARAVRIVTRSGGGGSHLRHVIVLEAGATLRLIEIADGDGAMAGTATSIVLGDGARLDHVKVQDEGEAVTHVAPTVAHVGGDVRFNTFTLTLGAGLAREERHVRFQGEGTIASVSGAFLLGGRTHADMTLQIDHDKGGCESREVFKGIVDDQARSVVQNRVVVAPDAQKTDARQAVHALLLSDECEHNTKPELEIYADDVQCAHGATIGELDEDALFYLTARGIPRRIAEGLLIEAFVTGAIEEIEDEPMRDAVMALAQQRLGKRMANG